MPDQPAAAPQHVLSTTNPLGAGYQGITAHPPKKAIFWALRKSCTAIGNRKNFRSGVKNLRNHVVDVCTLNVGHTVFGSLKK